MKNQQTCIKTSTTKKRMIILTKAIVKNPILVLAKLTTQVATTKMSHEFECHK